MMLTRRRTDDFITTRGLLSGRFAFFISFTASQRRNGHQCPGSDKGRSKEQHCFAEPPEIEIPGRNHFGSPLNLLKWRKSMVAQHRR